MTVYPQLERSNCAKHSDLFVRAHLRGFIRHPCCKHSIADFQNPRHDERTVDVRWG